LLPPRNAARRSNVRRANFRIHSTRRLKRAFGVFAKESADTDWFGRRLKATRDNRVGEKIEKKTAGKNGKGVRETRAPASASEPSASEPCFGLRRHAKGGVRVAF
jgi:hypothetical protein